MDKYTRYSRRERQIMDVLHRRGRSTAAEVGAELDGQPANATVRTLLRILVDKGQVRFDREGRSYFYSAVADREGAGETMMGHVVRTFFGGSAVQAMASLLGRQANQLTAAQLEELERLILEAKGRAG